MQLLTIMQFAGVFGIYIFLAVFLPALVLYRKFKQEPFYARFMVYITFGNFYIMNLVFAVQLLHISNRFTLILGTVIFFLFAIKKVYRIRPFNSFKNMLKTIMRLLKGTMGLRLLIKRILWYFSNIVKASLKRMLKSIIHSWTEWICTIIIICLLLWMYGTNMVTAFGYGASDIPVHNYWINEMDDNNIFAAGIYPFGFHCVIYYIHTVFGVKTYILLRLFGVVQTIFIHMALLAFIRACCKSKYIPYAVTAFYICISFLNINTYSRYCSALPQEFGMIFILPSIYFIYRFFEARKKELFLKKSLLPDTGDVIDEVRKKYKYKDIKGKIIVEIEVFEKKDKKQDTSDEGYSSSLVTEDGIYSDSRVILEESEGIDGRAINESLELCEDIKETYKVYHDNTEMQDPGLLFKEMASSIKKAEEDRPWEKVLYELETGTLLSGSSVPEQDNIQPVSNINVPSKRFTVKDFKTLFINAWINVKRKFNKLWDIESNLYLLLFALCFSMTLAVHFYDTMIAGIFCISIAAGYCYRLFRKNCFGHVMMAGILSIAIAVLPMALAFAGGKPLQGSLGWGMEVILGTRGDNSNTAQDGTEDITVPGNNTSLPDSEDNYIQQEKTDNRPPLAERAFNKINNILSYFTGMLNEHVLMKASAMQVYFIFAVLLLCTILGLLLFIGKDKDYASRVISTGICIMILMVVLCAKKLGIPAIMDENRISIYIAYIMPVAIGMAADAVIYIMFGWMKNKKAMYAASMAVSVFFAVLIVQGGYIRPHAEIVAFETNDAITCITNIMSENKEGTYTICSANDELRMIEGHGYHYEIITFLRQMEGDNYLDSLTIPTDKVYFFIEKKPVAYDEEYEGSGQYISADGASNPLVYSSGLGIYKGRNRWIVMSRMYYWAKEFQKMYGKEMKVYYESKDFVCYVVEQNPYRLYDFSIDYWYNTREWQYRPYSQQ
ncbi:MAG: hypothetical protein HFH68_02845 [Lachnospiraceae bacterium]|nr:hypothetical protein [Lachnospiraceae bacterium]